MDDVSIDNFNELNPSTIPMAKFYYHLSDDSDQDTRTNTTYIFILLRLLISNCFMALLFTTM